MFEKESNNSFPPSSPQINPSYPSVEKVRDEIFQTLKGIIFATFCPALANWMAIHYSGSRYFSVFCGLGDLSAAYHLVSISALIVLSDFFFFYYHRVGHVFRPFWESHKPHHSFFNPTPFAVIADDWSDQFFRSLPLVVVPFFMPASIDLLFYMYAVCFYCYGAFLHLGHEMPWLSAHNPLLNTSFHHYCHHAKSSMNQPFNCGFVFKVWDDLFRSQYPREKCFCVECREAKGELRTREQFDKLVIPDYGRLLTFKLWREKLPSYLLAFFEDEENL